MKDKYVYFTDKGFLEKSLEKNFKQMQREGTFEDVGMKHLYDILGPNDFACRAVYEVIDRRKFLRFALEENLNFNYIEASTREEFDKLYNHNTEELVSPDDKYTLEDLKIINNYLHHRVVAYEQNEKGNRFFDVEYNNSTDPDQWHSWGVSSIHLKDLEKILDSINSRQKKTNFFKTIHTFRILEKRLGINKVIKTIKNDLHSLSFEDYLKMNRNKKNYESTLDL